MGPLASGEPDEHVSSGGQLISVKKMEELLSVRFIWALLQLMSGKIPFGEVLPLVGDPILPLIGKPASSSTKPNKVVQTETRPGKMRNI